MSAISYNVGDHFEGVLVQTFREAGKSRPRVKPVGIFENSMNVWFPTDLRIENPIGTQFRLDVKVCQKTKNGTDYGNVYLVADKKSIVKVESFRPEKIIRAVKLRTVSDRAYIYVEQDIDESEDIVFTELREKSLILGNVNPDVGIRTTGDRVVRLEIIRIYALARADGFCEGCESQAPFIRRNGEPYLEIHHIMELSRGGGDVPQNVVALCPNCHAKITHGITGADYNQQLLEKVRLKERTLDVGQIVEKLPTTH